MNNCGNCKFFFRPEQQGTGQCRVRAPTVGFVMMPDLRGDDMVASIERGTSFPMVGDDAWCGEWKPAEAAA